MHSHIRENLSRYTNKHIARTEILGVSWSGFAVLIVENIVGLRQCQFFSILCRDRQELHSVFAVKLHPPDKLCQGPRLVRDNFISNLQIPHELLARASGHQTVPTKTAAILATLATVPAIASFTASK